MAIDIQMRNGVIEVTLKGEVTPEELQRHLQEIGELEQRLEVTPDRIVDVTAASVDGLDSCHVVEIAKGRKVAQLKNKVKSAFIAGTPIQFGLARMFMAYNQNPNIEIMIFKDAASARAWINS